MSIFQSPTQCEVITKSGEFTSSPFGLQNKLGALFRPVLPFTHIHASEPPMPSPKQPLPPQPEPETKAEAPPTTVSTTANMTTSRDAM